MKLSRAANDNKTAQIARTRQVWQSRTGRDLCADDARQIARNLAGFFQILMEWSDAERRCAANDNAGTNKSGDGEVGRDR